MNGLTLSTSTNPVGKLTRIGYSVSVEVQVSSRVYNATAREVGTMLTASASGENGHEELQLIMKTVMAEFRSDTTLLILGNKGKN
jgi:hypothetical protein